MRLGNDPHARRQVPDGAADVGHPRASPFVKASGVNQPIDIFVLPKGFIYFFFNLASSLPPAFFPKGFNEATNIFVLPKGFI